MEELADQTCMRRRERDRERKREKRRGRVQDWQLAGRANRNRTVTAGPAGTNAGTALTLLHPYPRRVVAYYIERAAYITQRFTHITRLPSITIPGNRNKG